jgi:hypothetical protein
VAISYDHSLDEEHVDVAGAVTEDDFLVVGDDDADIGEL